MALANRGQAKFRVGSKISHANQDDNYGWPHLVYTPLLGPTISASRIAFIYLCCTVNNKVNPLISLSNQPHVPRFSPPSTASYICTRTYYSTNYDKVWLSRISRKYIRDRAIFICYYQYFWEFWLTSLRSTITWFFPTMVLCRRLTIIFFTIIKNATLNILKMPLTISIVDALFRLWPNYVF